jgi:hypothetical protein
VNIIHIFTVHPLPTEPHAVYTVYKQNYLLLAESVEAGYQMIKDFTGVAGASEVYASSFGSGAREIAGPNTLMTQKVSLGDHIHWRNVQERYSLIASGPESLEAFFERQFKEIFPHIA